MLPKVLEPRSQSNSYFNSYPNPDIPQQGNFNTSRQRNYPQQQNQAQRNFQPGYPPLKRNTLPPRTVRPTDAMVNQVQALTEEE